MFQGTIPRVRIRDRRVGLALVVGAGLAFAGQAGWQAFIVPWVEAELGAATGHRITIASLRPRWRGLEARGVEVAGATPFATTPLARIDNLTIRFGGSGFGLVQPSEIVADGLRVTYLRTGALDNVRGEADGPPSGPRSSARPRPPLVVRNGRLEAYLRLPAAPPVVVRARAFYGTFAAGANELRAEGVSAELQGALTLSLPELTVRSRAGARSLAGANAMIVVPGGGALVTGLGLEGQWNADRGLLTFANPAAAEGSSSGALSGSLRLQDGGAQGALSARGVSLRALYPVLAPRGLDTTRAVADLSAELEAEPGAPSPFVVDGRVRDLDLFHPKLDRVPWRGLPFAARAEGTVDFASARVTVERGTVELLGLALGLRGGLEAGPTWRGRCQLETPADAPAVCADLLAHQPAPVREALAGLELEGRLGLGFSLAFDAGSWESLALDFTAQPRCLVRREPDALTALEATLAGRAPTTPELPLPSHPDFVPLGKMPRHLIAAFMTSEDGRFRDHHGFDLEMIRRALAHDLEVGDFSRGASTITQQLAKNLFLTPERTFARKLEEAVFTWRLDERLAKDRVLELYLNVIELGPGIHGVKRAAEVFFGKPLRELGPLESAHLAALTPNPLGYARRFRDGRVDDGWLHRLYDLLGMMKRSGRLSAAELAAARSARLTLRKI
jgi:hypothetical protein